MSRATINTGGIEFSGSDQTQPQPTSNRPCPILVLADFSGRSHRGLDDATNLKTRKIYQITRDNFDEIFMRQHVTLDIAIADKPIEFNDPEDLHPDYIYERVDLFAKFRALKRKLNKRESFDEAAQEIFSWANAPKPATTAAAPTPTTDDGSADLLDELLHSTRAQMEQADSIQGLIQQIAAPYVIPSADPRLPELIDTVDQSTSHLMRKILHSSAFQGIESAWRSLQWLLKRLDTDHDLKLYIADISLAEIIEDNEAHPESTTALHELLVDQRQAEGIAPFSMIVADYEISDDIAHVDALANLGSIAADLNATLLCGGSPRLAGCEDLVHQPEPADWQLHGPDDDFTLLWQAVREQDYSQHIALVAPRVLLRLPYGQRTSPTETFSFEELPSQLPHDFYLWGNGAYLIAYVLGNTFNRRGWVNPTSDSQLVDGLTIHVTQQDGESVVTPCAEILMTDTTAGGLVEAGLLVVRSVANQDAVIIPNLRSIHPEQTALAGPWSPVPEPA